MGGCSTSKEELTQMQKKMQLKGEAGNLKEAGNIIRLPKGGCITPTELGPIQFGMPPETLKDSIGKPHQVPTIFIIPTVRFDINSGASLAEFEFPAYFNYFVLKKKIILVTDEECGKSIRTIFQETLLGPEDLSSVAEDYPYNQKELVPDMKAELDHFAAHPENPKAKLKFEDLIILKFFDAKNEAIFETSTGKGNVTKVLIRKCNGFFEIYENGSHVSTFKDEVIINKKEYICHKVIEEDRFELVDHVKMPAEDTIIEEEPKITFDPPDFGITFLGSSNGFDPVDSTSGFIVWINQKGILVDPPAFSTDALHRIGIPPSMIDKIILTHVHADHDSGIFQKILSSTATEIITTPTIMASFVRKYSAIIGISPEDLRRLFQFRPITLNHSLTLYGATFQFFYSFHSIPCLGFKIYHGDESVYYTGDTFYDPVKLKEFYQKGLFSKERYQELAERDLDSFTYILHEAGGAPIHTTIEVLREYPKDIKEKLILYHIPSKQIPSDSGLTKAECGLSNTLVIIKDLVKDSFLRNLEIVSSIDFFEKIPLKRICDLIRSVKEVKYKQSDFIIREGTKGNRFYVVKKGVCKIYSRKTGREFSKFIYPGDHFGESAITGNGIRLANVVAETDCILLEINKHDFLWCLGAQFDSGAVNLMKNLSELRHTKYGEFINK